MLLLSNNAFEYHEVDLPFNEMKGKNHLFRPNVYLNTGSRI